MDWVAEFEKFAQSDWKPTKLSEKEEKQFQEWFKTTKLFEGFKRDVAAEENIPEAMVNNDKLLKMLVSSKDYDYRGAWKASVKEEVSPYDGQVHWPSSTSDGKMLKSPQHETTWKEFFMRQNNIDPDSIGLRSLDAAKQWQQGKGKSLMRLRNRPLMAIAP